MTIMLRIFDGKNNLLIGKYFLLMTRHTSFI
jgi:hypothetical protein